MILEHVSASQIAMYCCCPWRYHERYVEGLIIPPGIAMHIGSGVDKGIESSLRFKSVCACDMPAGEVRDVAVAGFDSRCELDGISFTKDEKSVGKATIIGRARDSVASMGHFFGASVQPEYNQPSLTQHEFSIPLPKLKTNYVGFIDLVNADRSVVDFKTTRGKGPTQRMADTSIQLTGYALAVHREFGTPPPSVGLAVLLDKGEKTVHKVLPSVRTVADYQPFLSRVQSVVESIRKGVFPPCSPDFWGCAEKWCGYWGRCPYAVKR